MEKKRKFRPDPKSTTLAFADGNNIKLWRTSDKQATGILKGHKYEVATIAFDPESRKLASVDTKGTIIIWDLKKGTKDHTITTDSSLEHIKALSFTGKNFLSIQMESSFFDDKQQKTWASEKHEHKKIYVGYERKWDLRKKTFDNKPAFLGRMPELLNSLKKKHGLLLKGKGVRNYEKVGNHKNDYITKLAFIENGNTLVVGTSLGRISLWDTKKGNETGELTVESKTVKMLREEGTEIIQRAHKGKVTAFALNKGAQLLASGDKDGFVNVWDIKKRDIVWSGRLHDSQVNEIRFAPSGKHIICRDGGNDIFVFDFKNDELSGSFIEQSTEFNSLEFSQKGHLVLQTKGGIVFWDMSRASHQSFFNHVNENDWFVEQKVSYDGTSGGSSYLRLTNGSQSLPLGKTDLKKQTGLLKGHF